MINVLKNNIKKTLKKLRKKFGGYCRNVLLLHPLRRTKGTYDSNRVGDVGELRAKV